MNSFKKAIASLTTSAMLVSSVATSFAAVTIPADVKGTEYEAPVAKLSALGIVEGRDDGNYDAAATLNRAEAAKIVVGLLGLTDAANAAKGTTIFTDVAADHWASGFIGIASEKGIVKGIGNDQFNPSGNVTVAELVTMLVRATGLGPVVESNGTWPSNYMAKASEIELFDDGNDGTIAIGEAKTEATRGLVAQLSWNALMAEKWGEVTYTSTAVEYAGLGKTLLADKYTDFQYRGETLYFEDMSVIATPFTGSEADRLTLYSEEYDGLLGMADVDEDDETPVGQEFKVDVEGLDYYNLLFKKVNVLAKKENSGKYTIVYLQETNEDTASGELTAYELDDEDAMDKITVGGEEYRLASTVTVVMNLEASDIDAVKALLDGDNKSTATIALDEKGKVEFINIFAPNADNTFIVKEVDSKGIVKDLNDAKKLDTEKLADDKNDYKVYVEKDGVAATLEDIEAGNVVTVINDGNVYYIVVTSKTIEGQLTSADSKNARIELKVDGEKYTTVFAENLLATSEGEVEDLATISGIADLTDLEEANVTLLVNSLDEVVAVVAEVEAAGSQFAVVTNASKVGNDVAKVQILTESNTKKTFVINTEDYDNDEDDSTIKVEVYGVEEDVEITAAIEDGDILQYRLNDENEILVNSIRVVKAEDDYSTVTKLKGNVSAVDFTADAETVVSKKGETVKYDGETYYLADETVIVNRVDTNSDPSIEEYKTEVVKFSSIVDEDASAFVSAARAIVNNDDEIVYMVLGAEELEEDEELTYAVVLSTTERNSKYYVTLATADSEVDGVEYQLTAETAAETGDFVKYTMVNDKVEIEVVDVAGALEIDSAKSSSAKAYAVKLVTGEDTYDTVVISKDAVVYAIDKDNNVTVGGVEDIEAEYYAVFGEVNDGENGSGLIEYIAIYEKDVATEAAEEEAAANEAAVEAAVEAVEGMTIAAVEVAVGADEATVKAAVKSAIETAITGLALEDAEATIDDADITVDTAAKTYTAEIVITAGEAEATVEVAATAYTEA